MSFYVCCGVQDTSKRSQLDLENEAENLGMQLHADAGREHFGVYAKCLSQDVPKGDWFLELLQRLSLSVLMAILQVDLG